MAGAGRSADGEYGRLAPRALAEVGPESSRVDDAQGRPDSKLQQVPVASYQHIRSASYRAGQHPLVIGVPYFNIGWDSLPRHDLAFSKELLDDIYRGDRQLQLQPENTSQLPQNHFTNNEFVFRENVAHDISTETSRGEGADQDVGVQEDLHETSRAMSSSVR